MRARRLIVLAAAALVGTAVWGAVMAFGGAGGAAGVPHFAVLNGANEVSAEGAANAGDLDGFGGAAVVVHSNTRICFSLAFTRLGRVVAAHIHQGEAGENAPVVVDFGIPEGGMAGNPGAHSGCVTAGRSVVQGIRNNPGGFYVNVHTSQFPGGAIRGQLF
jgi:hypothetical protein